MPSELHLYTDHYSKKRIYVQAVESQRYNLNEERRRRLETLPRVITPVLGEGDQEEWDIISPEAEPFLTQSMQAHFVTVPPGGRNVGHGHQNEAFFYILQGHGYELHDGIRYDWEVGDAVAVHNDCVHWHNNADPDQRAVCIVFKAKPTWLFLGLWQQGLLPTQPPDEERYGPPIPWSIARAPEDEALKKVIKPSDTPWEWTPHGRIRLLADETVPLRIKLTDAYLQEIPPGSRSGKRWQMADEMFYVLEGRGYDLHWDVEVEITDRYYARIAREPTRWEWKAGDMVWVPHNTVCQHFNADPSTPAKFIAASSRLYKHLGYRRPEQLDAAPEYDAAQAKKTASRRW